MTILALRKSIFMGQHIILRPQSQADELLSMASPGDTVHKVSDIYLQPQNAEGLCREVRSQLERGEGVSV